MAERDISLPPSDGLLYELQHLQRAGRKESCSIE